MFKHLYQRIALCLLLLAPASLIAGTFEGMVVFGDSLSDNGNLAVVPDYAFLNQPPYQHGFSNGKMAVVRLAEMLNLPLTPSLHLTGSVLGNNFSVAGARAASNGQIDLNTQVAAFLTSQAGKASTKNLYILFIGGNDIRDMRDQADETIADAILTQAGKNIYANLTQLIKAGASQFLVVNSSDVGKIPETQALAALTNNPALITRASEKTTAYNRKLAHVVAALEKTKGVDIVLFDLKTFFNKLLKNDKAYLFSNVQQACYSSIYFSYYPYCEESKLDSFAFFDEIHPSQRIHERVSRGLFAVAPEAY